MQFLMILVLSVVVSLSAFFDAQAEKTSQQTQVAFPEGYRDWRHIKSMVLLPGHSLENPFGGSHHVYGNRKAIEGLKSGKYADGATFAFDLFDAPNEDHAITEGNRKLLGVMVRNAKAFAETGGWGFEGFAGDTKTERLVADGGKSCFACHQSQAQSQYVFTKARD